MAWLASLVPFTSACIATTKEKTAKMEQTFRISQMRMPASTPMKLENKSKMMTKAREAKEKGDAEESQ